MKHFAKWAIFELIVFELTPFDVTHFKNWPNFEVSNSKVSNFKVTNLVKWSFEMTSSCEVIDFKVTHFCRDPISRGHKCWKTYSKSVYTTGRSIYGTIFSKWEFLRNFLGFSLVANFFLCKGYFWKGECQIFWMEQNSCYDWVANGSSKFHFLKIDNLNIFKNLVS